MAFRNIIVVGASAGGVPALSELAENLPKDLPAAVFVVLHVTPFSQSHLPEVLSKCGPMRADHAIDGEIVRPGQIYVAPPDRHLLVENDRVLVRNGPKENRFRPSIDALFRSAAYTYGARVIGCVLTGALDDGTSGLWTIKRRGGLAIIQEPDEAHFPDMPLNVLKEVEVDFRSRISEMGLLLARLVKRKAPGERKLSVNESKRLKLEMEIASYGDAFGRGIMDLGKLTPFTCPECQGALVSLKEGKMLRYRCHTGHAYTTSALLAGLTEANEEQLWRAMQSVEATTMLLNQFGKHLEDAKQPRIAKLFFKKARENRKWARVIHESVLNQERLSGDLGMGKLRTKERAPKPRKS